MSDTKTKNFDEALLDLMTDLDKLDFIKGATAGSGSYKYKYMDLPSIMRSVRPVLRKHSFTWLTLPCTENGEPAIGYRLTYVPTRENITGTAPMPAKGSGPQDYGSVLTYMRRYVVSSVLDIVTEEDDDAAKAQEATKAPVSEVNKQNILAMLQKLDKSPEGFEKVIGKRLDDLTNTEAAKYIAQLKTQVQRQAAEATNAA